MVSDGKTLWGYSCGDEAEKIQEEVMSFVDFGKLCDMQVSIAFPRSVCILANESRRGHGMCQLSRLRSIF